MAIVDVVRLELKDFEFCKKFPSTDLRTGSQLVVYASQVAIFVKGGKVYDTFSAGTYTLTSNNIPLLNKVINLPFGGDSPFTAEVWFINLTSKLNLKWGTPSPIQLEDPKYNIIVPVRAYGQYGLKVSDPALFMQSLIGNMTDFLAYKIADYFKGIMLSNLSAVIANKIIKERISILEIQQHLIGLSAYCKEAINSSFEKYGLQLVEFNFISINVPQEDPSVKRLKESKDFAAKIAIMGRDGYQMDRSFNVLEKAASNEGIGGSMAAMGVGIGTGVGIGNVASQLSGQVASFASIPPPVPQEKTYFIYLNNKQIGGQTVSDISRLLRNGQANADTLVWTTGMAAWKRISEVPEIGLFSDNVPPPPPTE